MLEGKIPWGYFFENNFVVDKFVGKVSGIIFIGTALDEASF